MKRVLVALLVLLFCGTVFSQNRWINRDFKYTHSGMQDINYPCPPANSACIHSGWNFEQAVGNYVNDYGAGVYTMVNNGAAVLVDDGTWPHTTGIVGGAQGGAWDFDGAADYLDRADDGSFDMDVVNNPGGGGRIAGDFSVQCVVTPHDIAAGTDAIIAKWLVAGNERGWWLHRNAATVVFETSVDGTAVTTNVTGNLLAAYRPAFITATYDMSTTTSNVFVDNNATVTSVAMSASINDSAADFTIAASDGGLNLYEGLHHNCAIYKGHVITEAQHDAMFDQWRGAASTFARNVVTSTASASPPAIPFAPPASGTEPFMIDQPANSAYIGSPVANSGGLYGASDLTSKWWRGSCETCDGANHCTGWTIVENAGAGAATVVVDCDATTSAHGGTSILFTADNGAVPKYAEAFGACQVNWINQDVSFSLWGRTATGTASCVLFVTEYSDAVCGVGIVSPVIIAAHDPGATWAKLQGTLAAGVWNVATASWRPRLRCSATGTAYTVNYDAAMALQAPATFATDAGCYTDAAADAVCTDTIHSIISPISANGQMSIVGTWRSPWAGTDLTANSFFLADGNAWAANTYSLLLSPATDEPGFCVIDNAAGARCINPNVFNWAADTDYTVRARTGGNDDAGIYWNAAWDDTMAGAGTGVRNAAQVTTYVGCDQAVAIDIWTRNLQFIRRKIQ